MLSKCQKRKSSLILDEGICKENVYAESSHQDFENRSKNAAFQKKSEFYYTFLLRLQKVGVRDKVGVKYSKFGVNENSAVLTADLKCTLSLRIHK